MQHTAGTNWHCLPTIVAHPGWCRRGAAMSRSNSSAEDKREVAAVFNVRNFRVAACESSFDRLLDQ